MVQHYYSYTLNKFEIQQSLYTDWIVENFRTLRLSQIPQDSFVTTYITNKFDSNLTDQEFLYKLFQLLSYIRQLDYSLVTLDTQEYFVVSFKFTDFLEFTGTPQNYYQVKKVGNFLKSLQTLPPLLTDISNICFQSINIFPYIKVFKKTAWYVTFAIAEELYFYNYPFYFPKEFLSYQNKYQFQIQLIFLLAFSVKEVEKVLNIETFLDQFSLSNSNLRTVKSHLLQTFLLAQDCQLIENQLTLVLKTNKVKRVTQLTTNQIGRTKLIYFREKIS